MQDSSVLGPGCPKRPARRGASGQGPGCRPVAPVSPRTRRPLCSLSSTPHTRVLISAHRFLFEDAWRQPEKPHSGFLGRETTEPPSLSVPKPWPPLSLSQEPPLRSHIKTECAVQRRDLAQQAPHPILRASSWSYPGGPPTVSRAPLRVLSAGSCPILPREASPPMSGGP